MRMHFPATLTIAALLIFVFISSFVIAQDAKKAQKSQDEIERDAGLILLAMFTCFVFFYLNMLSIELGLYEAGKITRRWDKSFWRWILGQS